MNYYVDLYSKHIILNNKKTLEEEYEKFENALKPKGALENVENKALKKELYGNIYMENAPFELTELGLIKETGYTKKEFEQLSIEQQGKTLALQALKNRVELIKRWHEVKTRKK